MNWDERLVVMPGERDLNKVEEASRIHRDKIQQKIDKVSSQVIDKDGRPIVEKELDYFEDLAENKYPNATFLKHLRTIRQFIVYFELKDELHKITEAEKEGVLSVFDTKPTEVKKEEKPKTTVNVRE